MDGRQSTAARVCQGRQVSSFHSVPLPFPSLFPLFLYLPSHFCNPPPPSTAKLSHLIQQDHSLRQRAVVSTCPARACARRSARARARSDAAACCFAPRHRRAGAVREWAERLWRARQREHERARGLGALATDARLGIESRLLLRAQDKPRLGIFRPPPQPSSPSTFSTILAVHLLNHLRFPSAGSEMRARALRWRRAVVLRWRHAQKWRAQVCGAGRMRVGARGDRAHRCRRKTTAGTGRRCPASRRTSPKRGSRPQSKSGAPPPPPWQQRLQEAPGPGQAVRNLQISRGSQNNRRKGWFQAVDCSAYLTSVIKFHNTILLWGEMTARDRMLALYMFLNESRSFFSSAFDPNGFHTFSAA